MRKRLTETQIFGLLKEAEAGTPVPELFRKYSVGNSTFYKWRSKYGGAWRLLMLKSSRS